MSDTVSFLQKNTIPVLITGLLIIALVAGVWLYFRAGDCISAEEQYCAAAARNSEVDMQTITMIAEVMRCTPIPTQESCKLNNTSQ